MGSLGDPDLDRVVARDALGELAAGTTAVRHYGEHGEAREAVVAVFVESFAPPPRMLVFGAVDFTAALVKVAKVLGYRVTVCDAREVFATRPGSPRPTRWSSTGPTACSAAVGPTLTPRDVVCVLTHDAKFDVPALVAALQTDVGYIGAMGSRRTHADRVARLVEAGVDQAGLARIRAPVGLDIGARTPEETAVSICAEIIAQRTGRADARPLRDTEGPIHWQGQLGVTTAAIVLAAGGGSALPGVGRRRATSCWRPTWGARWSSGRSRRRRRPTSTPPTWCGAPPTCPCRRSPPSAVRFVRNDRWQRGHRHVDAGGHHPGPPATGTPRWWWAWATSPWCRPRRGGSWPGPTTTPVAVATYEGVRGNPVRLSSMVWPLLPTTGDEGREVVMRRRPDLVVEVPCPGRSADIDTVDDLAEWS